MESLEHLDLVQLIIDQLSMNQSVIDNKTFIISNYGCQYTVYLENLPKVRIERAEPLDCFDCYDSIQYAKCAASYFNDQTSPTEVLVDEQKKSVLFRKEFQAQIGWPLGVQFYQSLEDIDQTVTAFKEACSMDDELFQIRLEEQIRREQGIDQDNDYVYGTNQ